MKGRKLVEELMKEYNLSIDDIRWYLSSMLMEKILSLKSSPEELTKYIWSGQLDTDLYNMEETYLNEIEDSFASNRLDESSIREQFAEASALKCTRF